MKLRFYGIVLVILSVGALSLPTNLNLSKDVELQGIPLDATDVKMQENESKSILMNEKEILKIEDTPSVKMQNESKAVVMNKRESLEMEDTSSMKVKFPQSTSKEAALEENEMEITPRILGSSQYQDKDFMETETKQETQISNDKVSVEDKEVAKKPLESTQDIGLEFQTPTSNTALFQMPEKCQPEKVVASSIPALNLAGMSKPSDSWNDFEDSKYSLLEDRLPDLTDEEFREINKEDSIPLNFLKQFDITKKEEYNVKLDGLKGEKPKVEPKLETPVYITIPIVINSHSNLPISLSIGGQPVPLDAVNKVTHMVTPPPKTLENASPPSRETNRHRNNIRSKIYARNNQHEVFAFVRDV